MPLTHRVTMTAEVIDISAPTVPGRRLYRSDHAVVAGVAGGLAEHLRIDVRIVRIAFVALTFAGGFGAMMYLAFWAVVPQSAAAVVGADAGTGGSADAADRPRGRRLSRAAARNRLLPLAAVVAGALLLAGQLNVWFAGAAVWPLVLGGVGIALVWREADDVQRARLSSLSSRTADMATVRERFGLLRLGGGVVLLLAGIGGFVGTRADWTAVWDGLRAGLILVAGLLLIFGPWWWRLFTELTQERRERIRSQERVEIATHVHDSVLHTLALIQRSATDPREVTRLARGQERELRRWLYRPEGATGTGTLHAALDAIAAEVEDTHAVTVEVIVVGDCPVTEKLSALVAAAREALVNAARHAGVAQIALFAEVEPDSVSVFVRDRGQGFDPLSVPTGRYGLAESVIGRMRRAGGTATVRSAPGDGTEVQLEMAQDSR